MVEITLTQIYNYGGAFTVFILLIIAFMVWRSFRKPKIKENKKELLEMQLKELEDQEENEKVIKKDAQIVAKKILKLDKLKKDKQLISKVENDLPDNDDPKGFNVLTERKSKFTMRYWRDHFKNKLHPESIALINMELLNGFHKLFLVKEKEEGFKYRKKKYIFDNEAKYFVIDSKIWAYDYHETFTLPIKRKIPITNIRKTIESSGVSEVEYATNPATLERFAVSKIAEGIMRGAELDQVFKFLKLMTIIILVIVFIHMMLFMFKTGMFQSIKIPGINA